LQVAAGLPDLRNQTIPVNKPKNVPPDVDNATSGVRLLQATIRGQIRADVIDHVFRYGGGAQIPVSGDFTGDGITNIGVFKDGRWWLDTDGNGRWSQGDLEFVYGQQGDLPVVGDWNGDGVAKVGVYRAGQWILDLDGNRVMDAHDHVFRFGTAQDIPVVGDWNGDGIDDPAIYTPASLPREGRPSKQTAKQKKRAASPFRPPPPVSTPGRLTPMIAPMALQPRVFRGYTVDGL
jgi:serine-aspartate repeat-containing protein C/D/E